MGESKSQTNPMKRNRFVVLEAGNDNKWSDEMKIFDPNISGSILSKNRPKLAKMAYLDEISYNFIPITKHTHV